MSNGFVGLDTSLSNTGAYFGADDFAEIKGGKRRGSLRLSEMAQELEELLEGRNLHTAVIEGYAFGAKSRSHRLGEIGGVLRVVLYRAGVRKFIEVPPTSLKKWATGFGTASKDDMVAAVLSKLGHLVPSHDVADAAMLYLAGQDEGFVRDKCTVEGG